MGKFVAWAGYLVVLLGLPYLFDSVLAITIFNQMAIAIVFALSYNMLLGQGGMLSFGHAVYFGLGGFMAVHALIMIEFETVYFSITLIPLVGGLIGLVAAVFVGSFSTHKAGTVFAMISLGIGELVAASSLIFVSLFGGEAGVSADRTFGPPFFGIEFFQDVEIYYLSAGGSLLQPCLCICLPKLLLGAWPMRFATIPSGPSSSDTVPGACALSRFASQGFLRAWQVGCSR